MADIFGELAESGVELSHREHTLAAVVIARAVGLTAARILETIANEPLCDELSDDTHDTLTAIGESALLGQQLAVLLLPGLAEPAE